jgi:hypothetical protein
MNNELDRMWKTAVNVKVEVQPPHLLGGAEENHGNLSHGMQ